MGGLREDAPHRHVVDPLTPVPPARHPFQFWAMVGASFAGIAYMVGWADSSAWSVLTPDWAIKGMGLLLWATGSTALIGAWWPDRISGLLLERIALASLSAGCVLHAGVLAYMTGLTYTMAVTFTFSVGIAAGWRVVHVNRELGTLKRWIAEFH